MKIAVASFFAAASLLTACTAENPAPTPTVDMGNTLATVDGRAITESMLSYYSRTRAQKEAEDLTPEEREGLMNEVIQLVLLGNAAESGALMEDSSFLAELELQRLQTVARRQITAYLDENPITEADLQQAYQENLERLSGMQYKARHILVDAETEAQDIIAELQQGADFQELARTRSTGPSGPNGGDLGWFTADRMVPPFAAAVRSMEVGAFSSSPVQTRFGWHVILLEEKSEGTAPGLDAVRDDVTAIAEQGKVQEYLENLRGSATISAATLSKGND